MTDVQRQVVMLPWLTVAEPIEFGAFRFAHASTLTLPSDLATELGLIFGTFRELDGREVDPIIVWSSADGPTPAYLPITPSDDLTRHVQLLFVAALCATDYFTFTNPVNASHFEIVGQNFQKGGEYVSFASRRRDGNLTQGGMKLADVRVTVPTSAGPAQMPELDPSLLSSLDKALGATSDSQMQRLVRSAEAIFRGNEMALSDTIDEDVFWCVSAVERLLVADRDDKKRKLKTELLDSLGIYADAAARQILDDWAHEAYDTRSEVHGLPAQTSEWSKFVHALLATEAYTLLVRELLTASTDVPYQRTDRDDVALYRFPLIVAALRNFPDSKVDAPVWNGATADARSDRTTARVTAALTKQP